MPTGKNKSGTGYIIESIKLGRYLKVSAIDPVSMLEASVIGPADPISQKLLEKQAVKKLRRALSSEQND